MLMNSDPNSDSKKCPESKLGRVHSAHTHGPGFMHTAPRPRAQRSLGAVSWRVERRIVRPRGRVVNHLLPYLRPPVAIQNYIVTPRAMPHALRALSCARPTVSKVMSQHTAAMSQCCIASLLRHIAT